MTRQQIRRLANNQLEALIRREPDNDVAREEFAARLDAYRIPSQYSSLGKEGWHE